MCDIEYRKRFLQNLITYSSDINHANGKRISETGGYLAWLVLAIYQRMPILVFDALSGSDSQDTVINMCSLYVGVQEQLL